MTTLHKNPNAQGVVKIVVHPEAVSEGTQWFRLMDDDSKIIIDNDVLLSVHSIGKPLTVLAVVDEQSIEIVAVCKAESGIPFDKGRIMATATSPEDADTAEELAWKDYFSYVGGIARSKTLLDLWNEKYPVYGKAGFENAATANEGFHPLQVEAFYQMYEDENE